MTIKVGYKLQDRVASKIKRSYVHDGRSVCLSALRNIGRTCWEPWCSIWTQKSQISSQYLEQFKLRVEFKEQLKFISLFYSETDLRLSSDKNYPLLGNNRKRASNFQPRNGTGILNFVKIFMRQFNIILDLKKIYYFNSDVLTGDGETSMHCPPNSIWIANSLLSTKVLRF